MPKDFMCDRLTENSPLRFLDIDIGNLIHSKYRLSIPYVLQAIFDEGRWRSARRVKGQNGKSWDYEWRHFVRYSRNFELLNSFWKYGGSYGGGRETNMLECYSGEKPKIKLQIGDKVMKVDCDVPIRLGQNYQGQQGNYTPSICRTEIEQLSRQLQTKKYILFSAQEGDTGRNSFLCQKLWGSNERRAGEKFSPMTEAECARWKKAVMKRQGVEEIWRIQNTNFNMPPLRPNIYQTKTDIMKHIQQEFQMEEKEIKKLNKKYNTAQIVKMYWKDIIDCF
jgi:hypothetical protein